MNKLTRKIATVAAALTVSLGIVAVAAPAQAVIDTSWGRSVAPAPATAPGPAQ